MDSAINVAATDTNYIVLYGDFQNFVIVTGSAPLLSWCRI